MFNEKDKSIVIQNSKIYDFYQIFTLSLINLKFLHFVAKILFSLNCFQYNRFKMWIKLATRKNI